MTHSHWTMHYSKFFALNVKKLTNTLEMSTNTLLHHVIHILSIKSPLTFLYTAPTMAVRNLMPVTKQT